MRSRDADSSTRSIALSGRKRSVMYRSDSVAAATSAESVMRTPWWTSYRSRRPRRIEIVSSTVGWSTKTCWKRRSSAASFSMCLRYSSSVVAPIVCSSPRASIGLSRFEASIAPSAAPGADDGVELVDEQDDAAVGVLDLLQDRLEALLELAPELGAGDQRAEVERDDALVLERLGDVAADDPLREALDDRGLADAGLADQDRVVLGPAREDLHDPPDLVVAADDRVELAGARLGGEVAAVLLERLVGALGVGRRHALPAADRLERGEDLLLAGAVALEQLLALAPDLGDAEEQVLGRGVLVAQPARLFLGALDHPLRARVERQRAALDPGALGEDRGELAAERRQVHAQAAERLGGHAVIGLDERGQDVLGVEHGALEPLRELLGGDDGLLGLLGEAVELHGTRGLAGSGSRVGLVDEVEELLRRGLSPRRRDWSAGPRGPGRRGRPAPSPLNVGMPWPLSRNVLPFWVPAGTLSRTRPLSVPTGISPPSRASRRVIGSSRSRSSPLAGERAMGLELRDDDEVAAVRPLPVSRIRLPVPAPRGIVTSRRRPPMSTIRRRPVERLLERQLGRHLDGLVARADLARGAPCRTARLARRRCRPQPRRPCRAG